MDHEYDYLIYKRLLREDCLVHISLMQAPEFHFLSKIPWFLFIFSFKNNVEELKGNKNYTILIEMWHLNKKIFT